MVFEPTFEEFDREAADLPDLTDDQDGDLDLDADAPEADDLPPEGA